MRSFGSILCKKNFSFGKGLTIFKIKWNIPLEEGGMERGSEVIWWGKKCLTKIQFYFLKKCFGLPRGKMGKGQTLMWKTPHFHSFDPSPNQLLNKDLNYKNWKYLENEYLILILFLFIVHYFLELEEYTIVKLLNNLYK